jgi:hypothetical protein
MTANLTDILSTQKNGVIAINNLAQTTLRGLGTQTSATITTTTLIYANPGYLVNFVVTVAGSTAGTIYNSSTAAGIAANNALCVVPNSVGITKVGQVFSLGLVVVPGSGQSINVTYSPG